MAERHRMDDEELGSLNAAEIDAAQAHFRAQMEADIAKAIEYGRGEMKDLQAEVGRSQITDRIFEDTVGWILPGLMRTFLGANQIGVYEPTGPEDEDAAKQATDYVNYVVLKESRGYQVLYDAFDDALRHRNGVIKHFWDDTPVTKTRKLEGLTDDEFVQLTAADEVEVIEHTEETAEDFQSSLTDPVTGEMLPVPIVYHHVKISETIAKGSLRLEAVARENFLINAEARSIEEARFVGERLIKTRSWLLEQGYDKDIVEKLPGYSSYGSMVENARWSNNYKPSVVGLDRSTDEIEVFETYPLVDRDGDGIAERLKIISAGQSGKEILDWEEWEEDDHPYTDVTPQRVAHRWEGRSIFDSTEDLQRIKTALWRGVLDNLYQSNIPDRAVNAGKVKNPDALFDRQIGNVIMTEGDPAGVIQNLEVPFVAQHSFAALAYCDEVSERRTGVSRSSMALDPETLQNQTATAANIQQTAGHTKGEFIARNFAEMGMERAFRCLLKLIVKHQDKKRTIQLRGKWVEIDPRPWNADMNATINVGLGSGSRDRDVMFLGLVQQKQAEAFQMAGGIATGYGKKLAKAMLHTAEKLIEATGLRSPEMYFPEITEEELAEIAEAQGQNPEAMKAQAEMAMKQQEAQFKAQLEQVAMQKEAALEEAQAQADLKVEQAETSGKRTLEQMKFEFQRQMEMLKFWMDMQRENARMAGQQQGDGKAPSVPLDQVRDIIKRSGVEIPAELEAMKPPPTPVENLSEQMMKLQQENRELFGQLASYIAAPVKVIRDPETGKVTGGQKVLN